MLNIKLSIKEKSRTRNYRLYEFIYDDEEYLLLVYFDEKPHRKMWECDKEVPLEAQSFLTEIICGELKEFRSRIQEIIDIFDDWIMELKNNDSRIPNDLEFDKNSLNMQRNIIDMIYNYD